MSCQMANKWMNLLSRNATTQHTLDQDSKGGYPPSRSCMWYWIIRSKKVLKIVLPWATRPPTGHRLVGGGGHAPSPFCIRQWFGDMLVSLVLVDLCHLFEIKTTYKQTDDRQTTSYDYSWTLLYNCNVAKLNLKRTVENSDVWLTDN